MFFIYLSCASSDSTRVHKAKFVASAVLLQQYVFLKKSLICHITAKEKLIVELVLVQIKKFKDAVARYGDEGCSFTPAKSLEESELLTLASIGQISKKSII